MSESSAQNKTEKPTQKKKKDARKKGQIARSKELVTFSVLIISSAFLLLMSKTIINTYKVVLHDSFYLKSNVLFYKTVMLSYCFNLILKSLIFFMPFPIILLVVIYLSNICLGGSVFIADKLIPKLSNINPIQGFKKIFSLKGLQELIQAIIKSLLIFFVSYIVIKSIYPKLLKISLLPFHMAMYEFYKDYLLIFLLLSFCIILIVFIDVPMQIYMHQKKLKMSKQEIKDEFKQTEGNPQIKGQLRKLQRQASKRRKMIRRLPEANILVTNPTHFAVALKYDEDTMNAPMILVMGADLMALHIRRLSIEYKIPILEIPLLARALYYNGEVGEEIPELLFHAVAQVVAYIYKLDDPLSFHLDKYWIDQLPIPNEMLTEQ